LSYIFQQNMRQKAEKCEQTATFSPIWSHCPQAKALLARQNGFACSLTDLLATKNGFTRSKTGAKFNSAKKFRLACKKDLTIFKYFWASAFISLFQHTNNAY
jgi:hypothetical protein